MDPKKFGYQIKLNPFVIAGQETCKKAIWVLDSGCSNHMTGDKALISQFEEKVGPQITFGDDNKGFTMGYGNLNVGNVIIKEISLVGGLKHNLLSISQFTDKGYKVEFMKNRCLITHKKIRELALSGVRKGSLFVVDLDSANKDKIFCFYTKASSEEKHVVAPKAFSSQLQGYQLSSQKRDVKRYSCTRIQAIRSL